MSEITFRPLAETDIPMLKRWLEDPDVSPWYEEDSTALDTLRASYLPIITGEEPTRSYIIRIGGRDAGYIQCYVIDDHPDYAGQIGVDPGAVGIDLFLGEPWARDRGHGAEVLRALLREVVFGEMAAEVAIIAPAPDNARAIRAYERAGFRWVKTVPIVDESPANTGDEYVMRLPARRSCRGDAYNRISHLPKRDGRRRACPNLDRPGTPARRGPRRMMPVCASLRRRTRPRA